MSASPPLRTPPSPPEGVAPYLSVVLPVFNEGQVLDRNLDRLVAFLEEQQYGGAELDRSFEIVAVDDGSRDDSRAILDARAAADPRLRVLGFEQNRGKGAAVRDGMLAARGSYAVFMDADLSTPLEEFGPLVAALESGYDAVLGNRRSPGSQIERHQPWLRETLGKGFTLLTQLLLVPGVHDFTCGFKGFRRDAARTVFSRSTLDRWAFDAELVVIISEQGLRLAQVPVRWKHEDDTKVRVLSAATRALFDLLRVRVRRMRGLYR